MLYVTRFGVHPSLSISLYTSSARWSSPALMQTFISALYVCTLHWIFRCFISAMSSIARRSACWAPHCEIIVVNVMVVHRADSGWLLSSLRSQSKISCALCEHLFLFNSFNSAASAPASSECSPLATAGTVDISGGSCRMTSSNPSTDVSPPPLYLLFLFLAPLLTLVTWFQYFL